MKRTLQSQIKKEFSMQSCMQADPAIKTGHSEN